MTEIYLPFAMLIILASSWLIVMGRLLVRLAVREPRVYARLGRPVMRLLFWEIPAQNLDAHGPVEAPARTREGERNRDDYSPEELKNISTLLEFVLSGRFHVMRDEEARRLGATLRLIILAFPLGLAGLLTI